MHVRLKPGLVWVAAVLAVAVATPGRAREAAPRKLALRETAVDGASAGRRLAQVEGSTNPGALPDDGGNTRVPAAAAQLAEAIAEGQERVPAAAAELARPDTPSGMIPPEIVAEYQQAAVAGEGDGKQPGTFGPQQYAEVLDACYLFYEAQRSGRLPSDNRVSWRRDAHTADVVPGGWYDAGDYIKHALTVAQSATFIAWGALDFKAGHDRASQLGHAQAAVKWAADYLRGCHTQWGQKYVGLIGNPDIDHTFWGRPEDQPVGGDLRPVYVWNRTQAAADLLGTVAASLASAATVLRPVNASDADSLVQHAEELYAWGASRQGLFSKSYPAYPWVYSCSRYHDKLMLAAGWLYRATGNTSYLAAAHRHWRDAGGMYGQAGSVNPYVSWDSLYAPAAALLLNVGSDIGASNVPGHSEYLTFYNDFAQIWVQATGSWGIVKTPKGLRLANWSKWGNLRYASNVAFAVLLRAARLQPGGQRTALLDFARSQVDYALGSAGRSYVVGWGVNPPTQPHHAAASCPDPPASCTWTNYGSPGPNPQVLMGALVAGPADTDDSYKDLRSDYVTNEVAIDYNAGLTGALAGLLAMLERAVASVCRRWRRVCWGEPCLWRRYRARLPREALGWYAPPNATGLAAQLAALWRSVAGPSPAAAWLGMHARALRRVGRHVASVELLLDTGHPAVPTACTPAFVKLLGMLREAAPALPHLTLAAFGLPVAAGDALSGLCSLRSLRLEVRSLSSTDLDSLARLAGRLTSLVLLAGACLAPQGLQPLAALTRLEELELATGQRRPRLPVPAALPWLRRYAFSSGSGSLEVAGAYLAASALDAALSPQGVPTLPDQLGGGQPAQPEGRLRLCPGAYSGDLAPLLAVLLPPAGPPLHALELRGSFMALHACGTCAALRTLRELQLVGGFLGTSARPAQLLRELLPQAAGLQRLTVDLEMPGAELPAAVAALTALTALAWHGRLAHLPPGPYLAGLCELDLSRNALQRLPPALTAATRLTALDLTANPALVLPRGDAEDVLLRLPALRRLRLAPWYQQRRRLPRTPDVLALVAAAAPGLRVELVDERQG